MQFKILPNYLIGYVRIEIEGYFIERLINLCASKNIIMWNSKRKKAVLLLTNVSISDFRKIVKIAKQTKCKVKIKEKKGLPFIFHKYKKRKIFLLFLSMIVIGILSLSNFIWNIEIVGNNTIQKEEIIDTLEKEGIKTGILKSKIDTKNVINKIRLERDDLAWIGIEVKGTNIIVKIVEADKKPEIIQEEEYCNIVATKPGIIVKVNALNGTSLVKEGDVIKEGTVLIGGWLEGKYTGTRYVHANGEVQAKVWYEEKQKVSLKQVISTETGNAQNKYSVNINNFQINFYKTLSKFKKYDTIEEIKKIKLFSDFYLPIEIVKKTSKELVEEEIQYTKEEAKEKALETAISILDEKVVNKENLVNTYVNYQETDEYVEAQVIYEVLEEIGTKEKIVF